MKKKIILIGIIICLIIIYSIYILKTNNVNKYELALKENKDLAVYVYDSATDNYVKQNSFPTGNYTLNETLSGCIGGGTITGYDNENGTVTFNLISGDTCYFYFDEYSEPTYVYWWSETYYPLGEMPDDAIWALTMRSCLIRRRWSALTR